MNNWRTTFFGTLAAIGATMLGAHSMKPELFTAWPQWIWGAALILSGLSTATAFMHAADAKNLEQVAAPAAVPVRALGLALVAAVGLSLFGLSACTSPPQRIAFNVAAAPTLTLDQVMTAWGDYVAKFHPGTNAELQVLHAYRKAKMADLADIDAAHTYADQVGSTNGVVDTVLNAYHSPEGQQALSELIDLVQSFGVTLHVQPATRPRPQPPAAP